MVRTQVQLTESQVQALRDLSASTGKSVADLVRQGVDLYLRSQPRLSREEQVRRALDVAGRFLSDKSDVSSDHDRYLAETFGS